MKAPRFKIYLASIDGQVFITGTDDQIHILSLVQIFIEKGQRFLPDDEAPFNLIPCLSAVDAFVNARYKNRIINMMSGLLTANTVSYTHLTLPTN